MESSLFDHVFQALSFGNLNLFLDLHLSLLPSGLTWTKDSEEGFFFVLPVVSVLWNMPEI